MLHTILAKLRRDWQYYLLLLIPVAYIVVFKYGPMYGVLIAFKQFQPMKGIWGSEWAGLKYFRQFIETPYFWQTLRNTAVLGLCGILTFPIPVCLALSINEVRNRRFRQAVQMVTYAPHFISTVVLVSLLTQFLSLHGPLSQLLQRLAVEGVDLLGSPQAFPALYIGSGIWQSAGYSSIIFIAALSGVDPSQYEAAVVEGANRFQRMRYISLPGILPTMVILLILNIGQFLDIGYEKIYLMQNPLNISASEVISTYTYKVGLLGGNLSFSAAVGLFNNVINFLLVITVNRIAKTVGETSLW